jgi:hypothetical protein
MGSVPAPVGDRSATQLLDAPGKIHILDHCPAELGHRVLHGVPKGVTYEDLKALEDRFEDQPKRPKTIGVLELWGVIPLPG